MLVKMGQRHKYRGDNHGEGQHAVHKDQMLYEKGIYDLPADYFEKFLEFKKFAVPADLKEEKKKATDTGLDAFTVNQLRALVTKHVPGGLDDVAGTGTGGRALKVDLVAHLKQHVPEEELAGLLAGD